MRWAFLLLLTPLAVSCASPAPGPYIEQRGIYSDELAGGQFNAHVGQRSYDDAVWGRLGDQVDFGINFVLGPFDKFFQWDLSVHYAYDEAQDTFGSAVTGETLEGSVGVLHFFRFGEQRMVPYVGAGLLGVYVDTEYLGVGSIEASDWSFGGYARAGVQFRYRRGEHIGFDVRAIGGTDLDMAGTSTSADAIVISMIFGNQF